MMENGYGHYPEHAEQLSTITTLQIPLDKHTELHLMSTDFGNTGSPKIIKYFKFLPSLANAVLPSQFQGLDVIK